MGDALSPVLRKLLAERKLQNIQVDRFLIKKEIAASKADLKDGIESFKLRKFKWATIQGYYALFHSARALLFAKGYREKSHYALLAAIRDLYTDLIEHSLLRGFEHAMYLRQEADYGMVFSENGASEVLETATAFIEKTKYILKIE